MGARAVKSRDFIIQKFKVATVVVAAMQIPLSDDIDEWRRLAGWAGLGVARDGGRFSVMPVDSVSIGSMHGRRGDWIIMDERGRKFILPAPFFDAMFERTE